MTTSKVVGVVGGPSGVPALVAFVVGFRNGAQCANKNAKVLIQYADSFSDPDQGAALATTLIGQGADVIFGAAGLTGNGAILYSAQHGRWSIGVNTDQYLTVFGGGTVAGHARILTSAMKRMDRAVYETVNRYVGGAGDFRTTYGLSIDAVGLAPFHEADASIPADTKNYVDAVKAAIVAGTIDINQTCRYSGKSTGTLDGWVLESTEISSQGGTKNNTLAHFSLGDDALDRQYRSILSFNTSSIPDSAQVTRVVLKIRKQGLVGTNPFATHGALRIDIRSGSFAANSALQIRDFQAAASKAGAGTFSSTPLGGGWYRAVLPSTANPYINRMGLTQFRLYFAIGDNHDMSADYLKFFSGNAGTADRPTLLISYIWP